VTPTPTFTEALDHLAGSLSPNPELDTEHQRALRVVVGELQRADVTTATCGRCGWTASGRPDEAQSLAASLNEHLGSAHPEEVDAVKAGWVSARRQALTVQEGE
jgi:hypothetical protein